MASLLRMPEVSANATEAVLAEWLVAENAEFAATDAIASVETEKAVVDIEAEADGVVLKALVPPGAQVEVGAPIAVLAAPGESVADLEALLADLGVEQPTDHTVPERRDVPQDPESAAPLLEQGGAPAPTAAETHPPPQGRRGQSNGRVFASPLARKMAKQAGLAVEQLDGTGPGGRIVRRDVEAALAPAVLEQGGAPAPTVAITPAPSQGAAGSPYDDLPHTRLRRAVATRLTESKQAAPHFYLRRTVRADSLMAVRAELNDDATTRVSVNDLVVKAVGAAHARVPDMNVVWTADAVRRFAAVDVAVAVATDRGLLTPVVRDVTGLTVTSLAERVRDLAGRAREGRLRQEELEGGTISVTNLGMYGVDEFAAIINPPHAAILAVGSVREEPVVEDGAVVPGQVMTLTLSVDHRPVDGVLAAQWMAALVDLLERPVRLLA